MPLLTGQELVGSRAPHLSRPGPRQPLSERPCPSSSCSTAAARTPPPSPPAGGSIRRTPSRPDLENYLLVFPESDPRLAAEWVHFKAGDSGFPTSDLDFVRRSARRADHPHVPHRVGDGAGGQRRPLPGLRRRLLQRRRHGLATAQLRARRLLPRLRRRRQGARPGEGPALPQPARGVRGRAGAGPGGLRARHRRPWLPPDLLPGGDPAGGDPAVLHRPGDAAAQRDPHRRRGDHHARSAAAPESPRW